MAVDITALSSRQGTNNGNTPPGVIPGLLCSGGFRSPLTPRSAAGRAAGALELIGPAEHGAHAARARRRHRDGHRPLDEAWSFSLGTPIAAPPMTYSVGGKQYAAVLAGGEAEMRGAVLYQPSAFVAVFGR
jgi:hypothetical protein